MNYEHFRHYARGWLMHFFGRPQAAFEAFSIAFRHDPHDIQAARHLAGIAAAEKNWSVAEQWAAKVAELAPDDSAAWFNLGFIREHGGHPHAALDAFARSTELNPAQDRAWYGMGLAHARLGQHAEAAKALREAVKLQPMNGEGFYQLGMALHHAHQPDEVTKVVEQLVKIEAKRAKKLVQDTERADLMHLIPEIPF